MRKAFTLVEILIVLVVIGIILAVVLPNTMKAIETANVRDTAATLRSIDTAINVCYSQTRAWASCDTIGELTTGSYLDKIDTNSPFGIAYGTTGSDATGWSSDKAAHFADWPSLSSHKVK